MVADPGLSDLSGLSAREVDVEATPVADPARAASPRRRRAAMLAADAFVAGTMVALAVVLRFSQAPAGWYAVTPAVLPLVWVAVLALHRTYDDRFPGSGADELGRVLRSGTALFTVIAVFSFATTAYVSRSIVLASVPATVLGSVLVRALAWQLRYRARRRGTGLLRTLVVGSPSAATDLVDTLRGTPDEGLVPVGICPHHDADRVIAAVDATRADVVAVVPHPGLTGHPLRQLSWALESRDVELLVAPGIVEVAGPRLSIRPVAGLSLLHLERPAAGTGSLLAKAGFDRAVALVALLGLSPVLLAVALAVRLSGPGPVFFRQTRVGLRGEPFRMIKFRSMVVDAEDRLDSLIDLSDGNAVLFKMRADPRVTRVGAVLRRFSLDELPQLINVVRGDMSLVGPRPPLPAEVERYEPDAVRRLHVRPGITGLWQVSGRSDLDWEQSLRLDLRYVDNWSLTLDLSILWRTARAVLRSDGAY